MGFNSGFKGLTERKYACGILEFFLSQ